VLQKSSDVDPHNGSSRQKILSRRVENRKVSHVKDGAVTRFTFDARRMDHIDQWGSDVALPFALRKGRGGDTAKIAKGRAKTLQIRSVFLIGLYFLRAILGYYPMSSSWLGFRAFTRATGFESRHGSHFWRERFERRELPILQYTKYCKIPRCPSTIFSVPLTRGSSHRCPKNFRV